MNTKKKPKTEHLQCIGMFVEQGEVKVVQEVMEIQAKTKTHYKVVDSHGDHDRIRKSIIGSIRECTGDECPNVELYDHGNTIDPKTKELLKTALTVSVERRKEVDINAIQRFNDW